MKKINNILSFRELSYPLIQYWVIGIVACLSFSYTQTLGDLNQDGLININDILREVNIILEMPPPPSEQEIISGDLNVDEFINISDIIITADIILDNLIGYCTNDQWDIPCENNYSECCYPSLNPDFIWEIDIMGCGPLNRLYDIEITENNNYIAVGIFSLCDDENGEIENYDVLYYENGEHTSARLFGTYSQWLLEDISYYNENDIWVLGWGYPHHYNGDQWIIHNFQDLGFSDSLYCYKMWGPNPTQ